MKKAIALVLALVLALSLVACGGKEPGPEKVVGDFCSAMKQFDYDAMGACLASEEDIQEEIENEEDEMTAMFMDRMKAWAGQMTYEVGTPEIDGDAANVEVKFQFTDASPIFSAVLGEYFQQAIGLAISGASEEEMTQLFEKILTEQLDTASTTTAEDTVTFPCVKTEDGWKIGEVPDTAINILTSNITKAFEGLEDLGE